MIDDKVETHPSYGMASFSHISSQPGADLFGSEFHHQHLIMLTITRGERHRSLARDWYSAREELIRLYLSDAQFVELITRTNMGQGVPVTLGYVMGERMPEPPRREEMGDRYASEVAVDARKSVTELRKALKDLNEAIDTGKLSKGILRDIAANFERAARTMDDSVPFVEKQFKEEVEKTIGRAKSEIEAHVSQTAMRIGMETMRMEAIESAPKLISQGDQQQ